jgi:viroplasmin and RNaseH domain-containing protein
MALVKGFSGAAHQRFDSLEEAEALLEDYDLGRIPELSISVQEAERVKCSERLEGRTHQELLVTEEPE